MKLYRFFSSGWGPSFYVVERSLQAALDAVKMSETSEKIKEESPRWAEAWAAAAPGCLPATYSVEEYEVGQVFEEKF